MGRAGTASYFDIPGRTELSFFKYPAGWVGPCSTICWPDWACSIMKIWTNKVIIKTFLQKDFHQNFFHEPQHVNKLHKTLVPVFHMGRRPNKFLIEILIFQLSLPFRLKKEHRFQRFIRWYIPTFHALCTTTVFIQLVLMKNA